MGAVGRDRAPRGAFHCLLAGHHLCRPMVGLVRLVVVMGVRVATDRVFRLLTRLTFARQPSGEAATCLSYVFARSSK